jgi:hypothetical protein
VSKTISDRQAIEHVFEHIWHTLVLGSQHDTHMIGLIPTQPKEAEVFRIMMRVAN